MTLLVDVGNSAIKWTQMSSDGTLSAAQRQLHRGISGIASLLVDQWRDAGMQGVGIIGCNVAGPEVGAAVEAAANTLQLKPIRWLRAEASFNGSTADRSIALVNGYRNPSQLGVDRWHCMLGAATSASRNGVASFVVVNAGTATTADCVKANARDRGEAGFVGKFIGGVITPGVRVMLQSLALQTAHLPAVGVDPANNAADFPDNTDTAMITGVLDAQVGLVEQIWNRFASRLKSEPRLILTGGYAEALAARLSRGVEIEHNLVLRGLALRARSEVQES